MSTSVLPMKLKWLFSSGLSLLFLVLVPLHSFADVLRLYDGRVVRGSVNRVTGDLIEFKPRYGFGKQEVVRRLQLRDRSDMVQTRLGQKNFGEIVYMDGLKLEMKTSGGLVTLGRWMIHNVVMGSPVELPAGLDAASSPSAVPLRIPPTALTPDDPRIQPISYRPRPTMEHHAVSSEPITTKKPVVMVPQVSPSSESSSKDDLDNDVLPPDSGD